MIQNPFPPQTHTHIHTHTHTHTKGETRYLRNPYYLSTVQESSFSIHHTFLDTVS